MTTEKQDVSQAMLDGANGSFRPHNGWADKAISQLVEDRLHVRFEPNTNSIAVIAKHVAGNLLSRWTDFLTTDADKPW